MGVVKGLVAAAVVSMGALGAGAAALFVAGFLLVGLSCWAVWDPMMTDICGSTVEDIERGLDRAKGEARPIERARDLTEKLHEQCRLGKASAWTMIQLEIDTEKDLKDKRWTRADQERFARRVRRDFGVQ